MASTLTVTTPSHGPVSRAQKRRSSKKEPTITRLIYAQKWEILEQVLQIDPNMIAIDDAVERPISKKLLVHFACRFQAPLTTLMTLAKAFPEGLLHADKSGRYPIHVASKWGAPPDVMQWLVNSNKAAASIQDQVGKTPMHYIGEFYTRTYQYDDLEKSMNTIVKLLKEAAPSSVILEDHEEFNAIEYAIENDAPLSVVKTMQRSSRDGWRDLKTQEQFAGKKHSEIEQDLLKAASALQLDLRNRRNATEEGLEPRVQAARTA
mmetsp:Transcript_3496/g.7429  ORF Transcript_3496/g.7429 Transcript_3496/m.7429 type:complete len:263 (-) Transcript_3496:137-925(-)|eukprot:CAMPEP_0171348844 /NCGR_PEP_ID=MMETSP0878-20121228/32019_1 /TAXON_ID=67004 /ORGANISM="Thalassiosira weissflogii, Strain CCMP1336" /LENGTH=262 /DNA_ID=CAMNT_0011853309 /DNA_START=33 /DNA_END=821 /DNA_ORIENTATION=-